MIFPNVVDIELVCTVLLFVSHPSGYWKLELTRGQGTDTRPESYFSIGYMCYL